MQKVGIFEPWTLGDVVVSLVLAKGLRLADIDVSVVCEERWCDWVRSFDFISRAFSFSAPWTADRDKYRLSRYRLTDFIQLRHQLLDYGVELLVDARGDIRHFVFLKALRVGRVESLVLHPPKSVYDRPIRIGKRLDLPTDRFAIPVPRYHIPSNGKLKVTCFFGASWQNRSVPLAKAAELVMAMVEDGHEVIVILSPDEAPGPWRRAIGPLGGKVKLIQSSVLEVARTIKESDCCVSTDSGWLHVSSFLGVPVIGLFAFDTKAEWAPPYARVLTIQNPLPPDLRYSKNGIALQPLADFPAGLLVAELQRLVANS